MLMFFWTNKLSLCFLAVRLKVMIGISNHLDLDWDHQSILQTTESEKKLIKPSSYSDTGMDLTSTLPYELKTIMVLSCSYSNELKKWFWTYFKVLLRHKYTLSEDYIMFSCLCIKNNGAVSQWPRGESLCILYCQFITHAKFKYIT